DRTMMRLNEGRRAPRRAACVRAVLWIAAGVALHAQEPAPQTPQARFRARADLVQVEVTVLDDRRRPVHGLTIADFTLLQDGRAPESMSRRAPR
ncbi:MAG: hypothetical protein ABIX28_21585, partial [Vicinamibacterales bacterium]